MVMHIFAINDKSSAGTILLCIQLCPDSTYSVRITSNKVNIVKVLVSMPAVHAFSSSALTLCFGLAGKDHTFDGRAFDVLLKRFRIRLNVSGLTFGFKF